MLTLKQQTAACVISVFMFGAVSQAKNEPAVNTDGRQDIFYGPAIISKCNHVQLYRVDDRKNDKPLSIDYRSGNFKKTKAWLFQNVYKALNRRSEGSRSMPKYCIALSTLEKKEIGSDLLLIFPLTADTLGEEYEKKIELLRNTILH